MSECDGTTVVVDNIGCLVTNRPELGDGVLGTCTNAALVVQNGTVVAIGAAGRLSADRRIDVGGRCVLPGFVDSHTHLVFAGDRAEEFTARMAGIPYDGGGILVTTEATREATDDDLRRLGADRLARARANGTGTVEIKTGYGLTVDDELRLLRVAATLSDEVTLLGAHFTPAEFAGRSDDYVELVCNEMIPAAAGIARWVDAFCERGAFDADQCRRVLTAGREHEFGLRLHGNQLGHGPGVQLAVEMGCASVDHCTYLSGDDLDALAGSDTVATFLPVTDFSTRQPYPDARRAIDAGVRVALASNCNPGSSYTTSLPLCIAFAVRDMGMTIEEAVAASTAGGAAALRRSDVGHLAPGATADLTVLDGPTYHHLAYRPGEQLIARRWTADQKKMVDVSSITGYD